VSGSVSGYHFEIVRQPLGAICEQAEVYDRLTLQ